MKRYKAITTFGSITRVSFDEIFITSVSFFQISFETYVT